MTRASGSPAHAVSEHLLSVTGQALMRADFAGFAPCFLLPQELATFEGSRRLDSEDDLRSVFDGVIRHFRLSGVTDLVRQCQSAEFDGPDTVQAMHQSWLLAGDRLVQPSYPSFSILRRTRGVWKIAFSQYAIADAPAHVAALTGAPGGPGSIHISGVLQ